MRRTGTLLLVLALLVTQTTAKRPWKHDVHLKHVMANSPDSVHELAYELVKKGDLKAMLEYVCLNELAETLVDYHTEVWPEMAPESDDVAVLLKKQISWLLTKDVNEQARVMIRRPDEFAALASRVAQFQKIAEREFEFLADEQRKVMPTPRAFMIQKLCIMPLWIILTERIADYRQRGVRGEQIKEEIRQKQAELTEEWGGEQEDPEIEQEKKEQHKIKRGKTYLATLVNYLPLIQNRTTRFERVHVTGEMLREQYPQIFDKPDLINFKVEIINLDTVEAEEMNKIYAGTHPRFPITGEKVKQLRPLSDAEYEELSAEDKYYHIGAEIYLTNKFSGDSALEIVAQRENMSEAEVKALMERNDAVLKEAWYAQGMRTPEEVTEILLQRSMKTEF